MLEEITSVETPREIENKAKILVMGNFGEDEIETEMTDRGMPENPESRRKIEEEWASKAKPGWFVGPLVRLENFNLTLEGKLSLTLGRTDFKEYVGSRDLESLRKYGYEGISSPLSTSTAIITSDGRMIIAQRVSGDASGSIDTIGGYVDPEKDVDQKGKIDIFQAARREITEETGINESEITEMCCLGLSYEYTGLCHPVASFVIKTPLTAEEIKGRRHEEIEIIVVEPEKIPDSDNEDYVLNLLRRHYPYIEPDGRVTIALARRWFSGKIAEKQVTRQISQIQTMNSLERGEKEPHGRIRYIGFDLDGTLIDTMAAHKKIFGQRMNEKYGIDNQKAADHYGATTGLPTGEQIRLLLQKDEITGEISVIAQEIDAKLETIEASPFPEIPSVLARLKTDGYHLFVSSSHSTEAVGRLLGKSGLLPYIDFFVGFDPEKGLKKGPSHFQKAAAHFQAPYETFVNEAIFVGDGLSDMKAAVEANVLGIGLIGENTEADLRTAKAQMVLGDLSTLPELLPKL